MWRKSLKYKASVKMVGSLWTNPNDFSSKIVITESGVYTTENIGNYNVIQFRSDSEGSVLNETYAMEFGTKTITETVKKKTVEKVVTDYDSITFTPVKITPIDCFATEGRIFTLSRGEQ